MRLASLFVTDAVKRHTDQKQVRKERVYSGSHFQRILQCKEHEAALVVRKQAGHISAAQKEEKLESGTRF